MTEFGSIGKLLIVFGIVLVAVGLIMLLAGRIPWLGRLPGDIVVQRKNYTFYFPITTSVLISIVLSLIIWLLNRK